MLKERRKRKMFSQSLKRFVSREARPIRGNLEQNAIGFTKIEAAKVEPIHRSARRNTGLCKAIYPSIVVAESCAQGDMMHAAGSLPGRWKFRLDRDVQFCRWPARAHFIDVHGGSAIPFVFPRRAHVEEFLKNPVCAFEIGNADRNRSEAANLMLGWHRALFPRVRFPACPVIDQD